VNAVKFTEPGGKDRIQMERGDGHHRVRISDTGKGIAPDFLPHVFDRFRQADGSTTRRHSGLGIGLALVRQLVELHGGSVRAESRGEGLGATFTVQLPTLRSTTALASRAGRMPLAVPLHRTSLTVLVVDDDQDARDVASHFLEGSGARVITAASADEGLRLLRRERPDVLVVDIGMPGTDGYAFIRDVRALPAGEGAETPAVALTALVRDEDRRRAIDAGYQSHMAKPVTREALVATVCRLHPPRSPV
jgi:CheY-like chemotaxis protein